MSPKFQVHVGNCLDVMLTLDADSIDSIVTDPPYGLEFMGKDWDSFGRTREYQPRSESGYGNKGVLPHYGRGGTSEQREAYRRKSNTAFAEFSFEWASRLIAVAKPGAHLLAFGGTRTFHRLACAIEDAGWEIRDCIMWVYGSGFPKSLDVSKAIDKEAGAEREVVEQRRVKGGGMEHINRANNHVHDYRPGDYQKGENVLDVTLPATDAAKQWQGWGTALKPAWEPIIVARKPLIGTVAKNVQQHGTGAINIDGCRVEAVDGVPKFTARGESSANCYGDGKNGSNRTGEIDTTTGRWPANLIHDGSDEVAECFPNAPGQTGDISDTAPSDKTGNVYGKMRRVGESSADANNEGDVGFKMKPGMRRLDSGSASRFFYCAKASRSERGEGNSHPTVKPIELMRYLCKLVTPKGGVVFDPFLGSGTTLVAAKQDGFDGVGIEMNAEYAAIALKRIESAVVDRRLF